MPMNIHVSIEWMLMGGWNHQYATATTITAIMAQAIIAFLPMVANLSFILLNSSLVLNSTCGAPCREPPPEKPPPTPNGSSPKIAANGFWLPAMKCLSHRIRAFPFSPEKSTRAFAYKKRPHRNRHGRLNAVLHGRIRREAPRQVLRKLAKHVLQNSAMSHVCAFGRCVHPYYSVKLHRFAVLF